MQCHSACRIAHIKAYAAAERAAELPLQQHVAAMEGEPFYDSDPDQALFPVFPEAEAGGVNSAAGLGHEPPFLADMPPPLSREPCSPLADLLSRGAAPTTRGRLASQAKMLQETLHELHTDHSNSCKGG
jgi:hypothetical protein